MHKCNVFKDTKKVTETDEKDARKDTRVILDTDVMKKIVGGNAVCNDEQNDPIVLPEI